jgi:hypothetical protein
MSNPASFLMLVHSFELEMSDPTLPKIQIYRTQRADEYDEGTSRVCWEAH